MEAEQDKKFYFSNNWFGQFAENVWTQILPQLKPKKVLEIGSYEGRSTCFLINKNNWADELEIHCIDSWEGGIEHINMGVNMKSVEQRFDHNTALSKAATSRSVNLTKHKGYSDLTLASLFINGYADYFDFVYVDGSHQAKDVLYDAMLAFRLTRVGGIIGFDDYTWFENPNDRSNPAQCPKMAVDAFTSMYGPHIQYIRTINAQMYVVKTSSS